MRRWTVFAVTLLLGGCDESEGLYRSVEMDSPLSAKCIGAVLPTLSDVTPVAYAPGRWSLPSRTPANRELDLTVVVENKGPRSRLEVFAQRFVPSHGRFTQAEGDRVEAETQRVLQAILSQCGRPEASAKHSCQARMRNFKRSGGCESR